MISSDFKIIRSLQELDFRQLMDVYEESNRLNGSMHYRRLSDSEQLIMAENDFYTFFKDSFFTDGGLCAVWIAEGRYVAALRLERYRNGLLLEGLETAPNARGRGYATALVGHVLAHLREQKYTTVYSHVMKNNWMSLAVHNANGFRIVQDYAAFVDGSVSHNSYTLCYQL